MKVTLDIRKSVDENAASYFEKAKKDKKKIEGTKKIIEDYHKKFKEEKSKEIKKVKQVVKKRKLEWFEKFRWFISSDEFLVIGGRDATSNEIVVKKHADPDDWVFHTDMAGSPFIIIKNDKKVEVPSSTMEEAAKFTAAFSRGWKQGMGTLDVFYVRPKQVSKVANPGEHLPKGAFMIRGETKYFHPGMEYAVGVYEDKVMGGPLSTIQKHCKVFVEIEQGNSKISDVAKFVKKTIGGDLDEIIRILPPNCQFKKK
jgi:predicted ribosome quality control (RQC) complex YloA/Tae2 family protein